VLAVNQHRASLADLNGIASVCMRTRVITGGGEKEEATLDNTPQLKPCHFGYGRTLGNAKATLARPPKWG